MRERSSGDGDPRGGPVPVLEKGRKRVRRRTLPHILHENVYGLVAKMAKKVRLGVNLTPRREEGLEHPLQLRVAHGGKGVSQRRAKRPQGLQYFFAFRDLSTIATSNAEDRNTIRESKGTALRDQFVGTLGRELAPKMQHFFCFCGRVEACAAEHRADLVETEFERSDHSEVTATAAQAPEEVLVFGGTRCEQTPIGGDHIGSDHVVDSEPIFGVQITPAAAQRQARHTDGRKNALCRCQAESL